MCVCVCGTPGLPLGALDRCQVGVGNAKSASTGSIIQFCLELLRGGLNNMNGKNQMFLHCYIPLIVFAFFSLRELTCHLLAYSLAPEEHPHANKPISGVLSPPTQAFHHHIQVSKN